MKTKLFLLLTVCCLVLLSACENYETYADRKEKERNAISRFIEQEGIEVISEAEYKAQGEVTDLEKNQFVRFTRSGVYMQVVRKGCGDKLEENRTVNILCRFMEKNILTDSILVRNDQAALVTVTGSGSYDASMVLDKMSVKRTGTTISGSFVSGMMMRIYGSSSIPSGWLVPLNYVGIGRPDPSTDTDEETAKVRLIVPHSQGTANATSMVYPAYYEITYERER